MRSAIRFLDAHGQPLDALEDAVQVSSAGQGWQGVTVETGHNEEWAVDDLAPDAHYLAFNMGSTPLEWEAKINGRFQRVRNDPGALWFCPAGESFSHRVAAPSDFALVTISPAAFARWTAGRPLNMVRRYGLSAPQLTHLTLALTEEARRDSPNGALFVEALGSALAIGLAPLLGAREQAAVGALPAPRLQKVLDYIEAHLAEDVTVDMLAAVAHFSPAHFARAFKTALQVAPHRYVLERRLARAREALERGVALSVVATECGFTDQSHLGRAFKTAFGMTPAQVLRRVK